jgi:hypothetical protein
MWRTLESHADALPVGTNAQLPSKGFLDCEKEHKLRRYYHYSIENWDGGLDLARNKDLYW